MSSKKILLTNDDGFDAPLIRYLALQTKELGASPFVFAPSQNQSCRSMSITYKSPMPITALSWEEIPAWRVDGYPADCVKHGVQWMKNEIDLVFSGINVGSNAGRNVLYSGTVGAAIEATLKGIPAIAFSYVGDVEPPYAPLAPFIERILRWALKATFPAGMLLNINFPDLEKHPKIRGIRMARQGMSFFREDAMDFRPSPCGTCYESHFQMDGSIDPLERPETDIALLKEGYVTIVPLQISDLTHQGFYEGFRALFDQADNEELLAENSLSP